MQREYIKDETALKKLNPVIRKMKTYGIKSAVVEFYGGGDSGCVDSITFDKEPPTACKIEILKENSSFEHCPVTNTYKTIHKEPTRSMKSLSDGLEDIVYEILEDTGVDWYNNEGGGGSLEIDLSLGKMTVDFNVFQNVIESVTQVCESIDLNSGLSL